VNQEPQATIHAAEPRPELGLARWRWRGCRVSAASGSLYKSMLGRAYSKLSN
jgi:hypothetical protein